MGWIGKSMLDFKEKSVKLYPVPKRVQELIPVHRISEDGIFELEKKPEDAEKLYDKAYWFEDANFSTMDDDGKTEFLKLWCKTLNSLNVSYKILVMNVNRDMEKVKAQVFLKNEDPEYEKLTRSMNCHMEQILMEGLSGMEQVRVLVISCKRKDVDAARNFFRSIEGNLQVNFRTLKSRLISISGIERIRMLHDFYRCGKEAEFQYDWDTLKKGKQDWHDIISPHVIKHGQNEYGEYDGSCIQMDGRYVTALYLPVFPASLNPDVIKRLTSGAYHLILTMDVAAVPMQYVTKRLEELLMQNGRAIEKQQETRNKQHAYSSDITYEKRQEKEELESYLDIIHDNDEKMSYVALYAVLSADTRQELENRLVAFRATAAEENLMFEPAYYRQIEVIQTAIPTGARYVTDMQPLFTQPVSALTPFIVQELYMPGGIYYGVNQISKNMLIGNRKMLKNGNGFTLGVTGGGKSMDVKIEMMQVLLNTKDDIIYVDPQNENEEFTPKLKGEFIRFGSATGHHVNPLGLDTWKYMDTKQTFIRDKAELMQAVFSMIQGGSLSAQDKSILIRCVQNIYKNIDPAKRKQVQAPTLREFSEELGRQPESNARELKLALEAWITEPMDIFAKQTNVNIHKRLTVFGLADLGDEQKGIGILILLELIRSRIAENCKRGVATWLYIDEFHNLVADEFSARRLQKIWKEVRKLGGLCTGITQQIVDLMQSKVVETMLSNSEYLSLLSMGDAELDILQGIFDVSDSLLEYVRNAPPGTGLLKFGEKYIPRDGRLPKDSEPYKMFNTNFHEKVQEEEERKNAV